MLLFLTNYLAILLTGAFMFGLIGFSKAAFSAAAPGTRRTAIAIVLVLGLAILVPLASASFTVTVNNLAERHAADGNEGLADWERLPVRLGNGRG